MRRVVAWEVLMTMHDYAGHPRMAAEALQALAYDHSSWLADEIRAVAASLYRGESAADAVAASPTLFDASVSTALRLGLKTGCLKESIHMQADALELDGGGEAFARPRWRLYLMLCIAMFVFYVTFFGTFIVPTLKEMFVEFQMQTPPAFDSFVALTRSGLVAGLLPLVVVVIAVSLATMTVTFRDQVLPRIHPPAHNAWAAALLRTLSVPIGLGRPASVAVGELAGVETLSPFRKRLRNAEIAISRGETLVDSLREAGLVNDRESSALAASTDVESMAWTMREIASGRTWRSQRWLARGSGLIRPLSIFAVAALVGWFALAVFQTLYSFVLLCA